MKNIAEKQSVLIVDDDPIVRELAGAALEQSGFEVICAEDGSRGIEAFERTRPDIVLLDVVMPVLDGFRACEALRKLEGGEHALVLMMTGLDDSESIHRAYEVGATDFITKPIAWPMLSHRVRYLLRANRAFLDLAESQKRLVQLALYDTLTGLPNRHLFKQQLGHGLDRAKRTGEKIAVLALDIDRFKRVNDTLGHEAGDMLLKEIAARLSGILRETDFIARETADVENCSVARSDGDEFTVLLGGLEHEENAAKVAKRILDAFAEPFDVHGNKIIVTASVGVTVSPLDGSEADALIQNAGTAMHYAKKHGHNSCQYFNSSMNSSALEKLTLETELRQALERKEFALYYQPKVDLETGKIVGVEALARWISPSRSLVPPVKFIPVLEETGLILELGAWALKQAALDHKRWLEQGLPAPRVAVNVSAVQLRHSAFVESVREALASGAKHPALDLELTESLIMDDIEANIGKLEAVKALGVRIAIDDFGTGYSSLAYLSKLPVETLKIDRSFVIAMLGGPDDLTLVSTMISLAHSLRLKVVAEGVDAEEQAKMLRMLRCDQMQGYLVAKPMPYDQITAFISAQAPAGENEAVLS